MRHYCGLDVAATLSLYRWQKERLGVFAETWRRLGQPALHALARVERWGAILDETGVRTYDTFLAAKIARAAEQFKAFKEIPPGFNVKSPDQMSALLSGTLKLKSPFKTKTGAPSWGGDALEELMPEGQPPAHPCLPVIREMLQARSMKSSYGEGQLKHIGYDGRVHTNYKVVRTGRLSSSEPNLQNLKKEDDDPDVAEEDDDGKWARGCWVCPPGWVWVNLDYSQVELRVAAVLSGDEAMIAAFLSGVDFHTVRASEMFSVTPDKVTKKQRRIAKCFHPRTEVLTRTGWKKIGDLIEGEEVVQAIPGQSGKVTLEWVKPIAVQRLPQHPEGRLVRLRNEGIDLEVTPDHRMFSWRRTGKTYDSTPADFARGAFLWPNAGLLGDPEVTFIREERFLRLAVATQADGSYSGRRVRFGFSKPRKIARFLSLVRGEDFHEGKARGRVRTFSLSPSVSSLVKSYLDGKKLSWAMLGLPLYERKVIVEETAYWDGTVRPDWRMHRYSSGIEQNVDVLQALATTVERKTRKTKLRGKRHWSLTIRDRATTRGGGLKAPTRAWTGPVVCLSVPSTYVLVRSGGVPIITGQCINFMIPYGASEHGVAQADGLRGNITVELAREYIDAYMATAPQLAEWLRREVSRAQFSGDSWAGYKPEGWIFRRPVIDIGENGDDRATRKRVAHAERVAKNTPIQWLANCFSLSSLARVVAWIEDTGVPAELVMTVHDNLALYAREDVWEEVAFEVRRIMMDYNTGPLPLKVDVEMGRRDLGRLDKVKLAA